jgi:hypothetical protein
MLLQAKDGEPLHRVEIERTITHRRLELDEAIARLVQLDIVDVFGGIGLGPIQLTLTSTGRRHVLTLHRRPDSAG